MSEICSNCQEVFDENNTSLVTIENVRFSTDGRKSLVLEYECQYNQDFNEDGVVLFAISIDGKIIGWDGAANGCGNQLSKNRESFKRQFKDFELKLKTNETNIKTILIEAHKNDGSWDGTQAINSLPLITLHKSKVKIYYEYHLFGKNVLEIKG